MSDTTYQDRHAGEVAMASIAGDERPHAIEHPLMPETQQGQEATQATQATQATATGTTTPAPAPAIMSNPATASEAQAPPEDEAQGPVHPATDATTAALSVRGNMLRRIFNGYRALGRGRRWILILRMFIGLAQIVPAIVILSLPTSLGNSPARNPGQVCDPEPIFVYLALHIVRVAASLPTDLYLSLGPHRNARQRRPGSTGFAERERTRQLGTIRLDRKADKLADLLAFCHVVLFAVGNYVVWSGTECSRSPADSVPLFWTSVSMLSISYLVILNVVFLIFMVVFFLPLLLALLRALGLQHRLPTPAIRPETGKIGKQDVDKVTRLVYYAPEDSGDEEHQQVTDAMPATPPAVSPSRPPTPPSAPAAPLPHPWTTRLLGRLLRMPRSGQASTVTPTSAAVLDTSASTPPPPDGLRYPLYPIPSHRATCPICLCDFESPSAHAGEQRPEPLRLLPCKHVLHMSCVDEWLCTVSGRCPVCQKPVMGQEEQVEGA